MHINHYLLLNSTFIKFFRVLYQLKTWLASAVLMAYEQNLNANPFIIDI